MAELDAKDIEKLNEFMFKWRELDENTKQFYRDIKVVGSKKFFKELDLVNGIALRNLSYTHKSFTDDVGLIATKNGIKVGYEGSHSRDLSGTSFKSIIIYKDKIRAWVSENKADRLGAFDDLVDALMIKVDGFGLDDAYKINDGGGSYIDGFSKVYNMPTYVVEAGEIKPCILERISYARSYGESKITLVFTGSQIASGKKMVLSDGNYYSMFEFYAMGNLFPLIFSFCDEAKVELNSKMVKYNNWEKAVKQRLQSYFSLLSL